MTVGRCPFTGAALEVTCDADRITGVRRLDTREALPWVLPGLVDLQVNGYAGHDVNGADAGPEADIPETLSIEGLPADTALLVVKRGPNAGSRFLLDQPVTTAGRHPSSDIFLDDVTVSRQHVEFRRDGLEFTVHDIGSLNGTYLNREIVENATLASGDEVQIGKFRLVFLLGHRPTVDAAGERGQ